jgi:hypothetical protein
MMLMCRMIKNEMDPLQILETDPVQSDNPLAMDR